MKNSDNMLHDISISQFCFCSCWNDCTVKCWVESRSMFYRWVFPNAQEQGQWRLDRSSLQDWTMSAERFQGNSVRSTYTDKHKYSIKHTYIYTYSTSLHVYANHRYSLSIPTTHFPYIILITTDHYLGFEAPIRHFNCIPDPWHSVYGKLRDAKYLGS